MSISLSHFKQTLNFVSEEDLRAKVIGMDIYEYPEYLSIDVTWYDNSEEEYKFYLADHEKWQALAYAHEMCSNVHLWSDYSCRAIYDDAYYEATKEE